VLPLYERFDVKVQREGDGCWRWIGMLDKAGYGRIRDERGRAGESLYAHRVAHIRWKGPIPEGCEVDHLCRNRWCVNPDHLEAVPHKTNMRRGMSPTMIISRTGKCGRGHEVNSENMYFRKDRPGYWLCRVCKRERRRLARQALTTK